MSAADAALTEPPPPAADPSLQRVRGEARVSVVRRHGAHRLAGLRQAGSAKVRLPRVAANAPVEAILLNTAGGVTGGDRLRYAVSVGEGASALATTQAAERAYRSPGGEASIASRLEVAVGGTLAWLPQETILFQKSALSRRFEADMAGDATLLAAEAVLLGRAAMGEELSDIRFHDRWRIRRDGTPVFAEDTRLDGDASQVMAGRATGGGARGFATLVLVAPAAETRTEAARDALADCPCESGVSGWNGMLVARMVASGGQPLRAALIALIETLRGVAMPRVWHC